MNAIREQALRWFSAERVPAEPTEIAEPDLTALVRDYSGLLYRVALRPGLFERPKWFLR